MRQSNKIFSTILTKIGNGISLLPDEQILIENRFRTDEWCLANVNDVVRLYHRNSDVDKHNKRAICSQFEIITDDVITGYNKNTELMTARNKLHGMSTVESGGLPYLIKVAIGSPYMITSNIDVADGLVNGAIGILKHIEQCDKDTINGDNNDDTKYKPNQIKLWFIFPETKIGQMARIKCKPYVLSKLRDFSDDGLKWTQIKIRTATISLGGNVKCKRTQFPLVPAAAITIHKSQDATFDRIVFDYDKCQQNQLVYVAMTRVTSLDGLYITNSKNDFTFYHGRANTTQIG